MISASSRSNYTIGKSQNLRERSPNNISKCWSRGGSTLEVCLLDQIYCEILYLIPLVDKLLVIFPSPLWDRTDPEETPTCIRSIQVYEFPFAIQFLRRRNRKHNQLSDCLNWFNNVYIDII